MTSLQRSLRDRCAVFALVTKTATEAPKTPYIFNREAIEKGLHRASIGRLRVEHMKGNFFYPRNFTFHVFNS